MKLHPIPTSLVLVGMAASLGACGKSEEKPTPAITATRDDVTRSMAGAFNDVKGLSTLNKAISLAELRSIFDGPASYTMLAPNDDAFAALGEQGKALLTREQRPMLIALLRDHILPGHVTTENIAKAIADKGGPVTMTTLGGGKVIFAIAGDTLTVARDGSDKAATVLLPATAATNGVIIPVQAVLLPPKDD